MIFDTNRWVEYDDPSMLLHRLTVDPTLDMRPAIERALRALATS